MATPFVIDTNVYVYAEREPEVRAALRGFLQATSERVVVSTVVLHELLVGAADRKTRTAIERAVLTPFARRLRLLETSAGVWREAAGITRALRADGGYAGSLALPSFHRDILIAASVRSVGATLVTTNARDFDIIAKVHGVRYVTRFPA
jgi:predicted nucleic acid-binding protein